MAGLKIITFGCQTNQHDSEKMAGLLSRQGYRLTEREEEADLILLNTCSIRQKAEQKLYSQLGRLGVLKRRRPSLRIGVCGCVAEQEGYSLLRRFPFVDLVLGTGKIDALSALLQRDDPRGLQGEPIVPHRSSKVQAWVEIMKGCDNYCAYCVVPHLRGREESRRPDAIWEEVESLASQNYKEITLLGHNVNSYGKGVRPPIDFPGLLRGIDERLKGTLWVRFATSHPKDLTSELARSLGECPSLCEHIHLPVQSGSDRVLARMNRGYTRRYLSEIVEDLRGYVPGIGISTDILVGFPGESEEDFQATLNLLGEVRFDRIFSFKYSPRPQTAALSYEDRVPEAEKDHRLRRVIALQNRICLEKNQELLGRVFTVLVEKEGSKRDASLATARTRSNHIVHFLDPEAEEGSFREVRILYASAFHLKGEVVGQTRGLS